MIPISLSPSVSQVNTDQIQAMRKPNDTAWRGLNDSEVATFSDAGNAEVILQLCQAATPGAVLKNGPPAKVSNFASDELDTAVRYQFWQGSIGVYPYVVEGVYTTAGFRGYVRAYVSHLVKEYTPDKTKIVVVMEPNSLPVYRWA